MTKGCSSYCHPGFILLALHTGFRFTERRQREIQLSMVGSCRTWNKDQPGLGRPRALPSSVPCRVAVIWMVLSGRHMSVNVHLYTSYCAWCHGRTPPPQIHHSPTVQLMHVLPRSPPPPAHFSRPALSLQPSFFSRATLKAGCAAECVVCLQTFRLLLLLHLT